MSIGNVKGEGKETQFGANQRDTETLELLAAWTAEVQHSKSGRLMASGRNQQRRPR